MKQNVVLMELQKSFNSINKSGLVFEFNKNDSSYSKMKRLNAEVGLCDYGFIVNETTDMIKIIAPGGE